MVEKRCSKKKGSFIVICFFYCDFAIYLPNIERFVHLFLSGGSSIEFSKTKGPRSSFNVTSKIQWSLR